MLPINYKIFKEYTGCSSEEDMNFFLKLLKVTLKEIIDELVLSKNQDDLAKNLHKLKGLSRYAGLEILSSFCELNITFSVPPQKEITNIVDEIEIVLGLLKEA